MGLFDFLIQKSKKQNESDIIDQCQQSIEKIRNDFSNIAEYSDLDWFFDDLSKKIIDQQDTVRKNLISDKISPKNFILSNISGISLDLLLSGQFCMYRGALNMEGQDLKRLYMYSNIELVKTGFMSQENAKDDEDYLNEQLRLLG